MRYACSVGREHMDAGLAPDSSGWDLTRQVQGGRMIGRTLRRGETVNRVKDDSVHHVAADVCPVASHVSPGWHSISEPSLLVRPRQHEKGKL
jgi:hypothetical protein